MARNTENKSNEEIIFNHLEEIVFFIDFSNVVTNVNAAAHTFFKQLGVQKKEFSLFDFIYTDTRKELKEIVSGKKKQALRIRFYNTKKKLFLVCEGNYIPFIKSKKTKGCFVLQLFTGKLKHQAHPEIAKTEEVKKLLDTIDLVMYRVKNANTDKREIEFISKNTKHMFGIDYDTYMKLLNEGTLLKYFHPEDYDRIIAANHTLKSKKKPVQDRYRFYNPVLKKYVWVEEKSFPILNKKGEIIEIIGVTRNINEQVEKEKQLIESETASRNIIEKNLAGFYRLSVDRKIIEANDSFAQILGFSKREQVLGKKITEVYTRSTDQHTFISHIKKKKKLVNHESELVLRNGETRNILENATYFSNAATGEGFVEGTIFDITELKRFQKALSENEQKYKGLFEENLAGVFRTTLSGKILDCNEAFIKVFGFKNKKELLNQSSYSLYFKKADRDKYLRDLKRKKILTNYEILHKKKDGSPAYILLNVRLEGSEKVKDSIIEGTLIDITAIKAISRSLEENVNKYKNLYENASDAILILQGEKIIDCNKRAIVLFGCDRQTITKCDLYKISSGLQDEMKAGIKKYFFIEDKKKQFPWIFKSKTGEPIYAEVTVTAIPSEEKTRRQCIIRNITDTVKRERELKLEMENYQQLIEHSPDGNLIVDNGVIVYSNPSAGRILGYKKTNELDRKKINEFIPTRYRQEVTKLFNLAHNKSGHTRFYEYYLYGPGHKEVEVGIQIVPVKYRGVDCLNIILYDLELKKQLANEQFRAELAEETSRRLREEVNQHKKTQQKLAEQVAYTRSVFESSANTVLFTINKKGEITTWNKSFEQLASYHFKFDVNKNKKFIDHLGRFLSPEETSILKHNIQKIFRGESGHVEGPLDTVKGEKVWFESYLNPVRIEGKKIEEISIFSTEITERKQRNEQIKQSLKEKEVLLKEVHHRVKNNLQIISSILNLQSSFSKDETVNEILKESQNRVKSMSFIHESLYQTKNFSHINISDYILNLSRNLVHSYYVGNQAVDLDLDLGEITLPLDQAIPCGLIINEIITNSLKYAFTSQKGAKIYVKFREQGKEKLEMEIGDNGKGLPKGFDIAKTPTLGLQLVTSLVEQLDGKLNVKSGSKGVHYHIMFNKLANA
ncbi:MAG: PAS domain S-box protein [Flavobacteriales bacterium]